MAAEIVCAVCQRPTVERFLRFRDDGIEWTLPVQVCTNADCLIRQGAMPVRVRTLAS